jgi:threonine dehydratase
MDHTIAPSIDRARIAAVEALIRPHVRRTPVLEVDPADFGLAGVVGRLSFKLEFLQHAGSFKARGAFAHLLTREIPKAGVVAASGGNHGAAVAFAAQRRGIPTAIFVPEIASPAKRARIEAFGARLVVGGARYADALAASEAYLETSGALPVHAYDQIETLLGQGTVGLELEAQAPDLDAVLVAVGGGGLIGGMASWYADRPTAVVGVEPVTAPTLTRALAAGRPVDAEAGGVAADSLAPRQVGALMFPIAERHMDRVVLVEDAAILQAQASLWRVLRVATEPGGAAAFAALLSGAWRPNPDAHVGVILCGANTDAVAFAT